MVNVDWILNEAFSYKHKLRTRLRCIPTCIILMIRLKVQSYREKYYSWVKFT